MNCRCASGYESNGKDVRIAIKHAGGLAPRGELFQIDYPEAVASPLPLRLYYAGNGA